MLHTYLRNWVTTLKWKLKGKEEKNIKQNSIFFYKSDLSHIWIRSINRRIYIIFRKIQTKKIVKLACEVSFNKEIWRKILDSANLSRLCVDTL